MNKTLILVVEDDTPVHNLITTTLKTHDYKYISAKNGAGAIMEASTHNPDIVLLDLGLPDIDGVEVIEKIRSWSNMPIIVISARSEDTDKITGLGFGADDYVTKPFNPLELVARVKSQIRRYVNLGSMVATPTRLVTGGLVLDTDAKSLSVDGEGVKVTPIEYKIMEYLMTNMGRVLSSSQIYEAVWNEPSFTSEKTVTVHIRNIREKIEINPKEPKYIKVVYGLGYKCEKI